MRLSATRNPKFIAAPQFGKFMPTNGHDDR